MKALPACSSCTSGGLVMENVATRRLINKTTVQLVPFGLEA